MFEHCAKNHCIISSLRTGEVIADRALIARTMFQQARGLIGRGNFVRGEALVLPNCSWIHMFFMSFAIDVLFCTEQGEVVSLVKQLKPWRTSRIVWEAAFVVELPAGRLDEVTVIPGDSVALLQRDADHGIS